MRARRSGLATLPQTIWEAAYFQTSIPDTSSQSLSWAQHSSGASKRSRMRWCSRPLGPAGSQLTVRALAVGLAVGTLLCCSNMYFGLQTGWVTMGSLQSAILGYGTFRLWNHYSPLVPSFSVGENVIVQTTAVATATMPLAAGLVGIIPAFSIMTPEDNPPQGPLKFSAGQLLLWSSALAFFGVFLAVPLRQQTIIREKLKFPSGAATASVIATLHGTTVQEEGATSKSEGGGADYQQLHSEVSTSDMAVALEVPGPSSSFVAAIPPLVLLLLLRCRQQEGQGVEGKSLLSAAAASSAPITTTSSSSRPGLAPPAAALRVSSSRNSSRSSLGLGPEADKEVATAVAVVSNFQRAWRVLLLSFAGAFGYSLVAAAVPVLRRLQVFSWVGWAAATAWGWELTMSMGYIGQGMIMGPRTCWSMLAGAVTGFAILGPIAKSKGWAPGAISDWESGATGWIMWVSLAVMMGDSLTSLGLVTLTSLQQQWRQRRRRGAGYASMLPWSPGSRQYRQCNRKVSDYDDGDAEAASEQAAAEHRPYSSPRGGGGSGQAPRQAAFGAVGDTSSASLQDSRMGDSADPGDTSNAGTAGTSSTNATTSSTSRGQQAVPTSWWVGGLVASWVLCTAILVPLLQLPIYEPLVALLLAGVVALLAVRALGQTDLNPVSGVGKLSQLVFALVSPGRVVPNLVAGAIAEAGAQQAGDMMQDFKTAHLLGVSPLDQFWAMLLGSAASVLVSVASFQLYTSVWQVPGPEFPAPTSQIWLDMAKLVNGGKLPQRVGAFCIAFGGMAAALPLLQLLLQHLAAPFRGHPSATAAATATTGYRHQQQHKLVAVLASKLLAVAPSGIGFAVGMYIAPRWTLPRVLGCVVERCWLRWRPVSHQQLMMVLASGLVLGEGTASLVTALVHTVFK